MRKVLVFTVIMAIVIMSVPVFAQGMGQGMGGGPGAGMGAGMQGQGQNLPANFKPVTQKEADVIAADYMKKNLKGAKVLESGTFQGKRFTGYTYTIQDASGNTFTLMVNARGMVRGPFPVTK